MNGHWGEISSTIEKDGEVAKNLKDQLTKPIALEVDPPHTHQPSSRHFPPVNEPYKSDAFQLDPLSLHTIRLIRYARQLRTLIHTVKTQLQDHYKNCDSYDLPAPTFPPAPALPEHTGKQLIYNQDPEKPLYFMEKNMDSDFVKGVMVPPPEIDPRTNRRLLRKSVAAICAHAGFDNCGESVLEILTDVSHEYMLQMTTLLRNAVDSAFEHGVNGYPDPIEQVFHEMGIGRTITLHEFYQNRVIKYHANMLKTCQHLISEYERVTHPDANRNDDMKPQRIKEEPMSDISFPMMEDSEDGVENDVNSLENLAFDMPMSQESNGHIVQDDSRWPPMKQDTSDRYGSIDSYDDSSASEMAKTPAANEDVISDLMSPPSFSSLRTPNKVAKKK